MTYFRLYPNIESKKWRNYENIADELFKANGEIVDTTTLSHAKDKISDHFFYYQLLRNGKLPPIKKIGSQFLALNTDIFGNLNKNFVKGVQLIPLIKKNTNNNQYLLIHLTQHINCVDWQLSEYEVWPPSHIVREWQNPRGRFFFNPVLIKNKIPKELEAFRLLEWGGDFNIIVSETFKKKIEAFDFDHSFLEFDPLKVI